MFISYPPLRMDSPKTLAALAAASGIPARTIRFYISRGLLPGPAKAGRGAAYTSEHLAQLEQIKSLQAEGRTLVEIAALLTGASPARTAHSPSPWWQHAVCDDVVVWARADVSPWRVKLIRSAIADLAARLSLPDPDDPNSNSRRNE
jgi:DNA-binding transcriptional MerR regulator